MLSLLDTKCVEGLPVVRNVEIDLYTETMPFLIITNLYIITIKSICYLFVFFIFCIIMKQIIGEFFFVIASMNQFVYLPPCLLDIISR